MLFNGYRDQFFLKFNDDSTVIFPGTQTEVILCKWKLVNKNFIISFDTTGYRTEALAQLDSLQTLIVLRHDLALQKLYNFKRDSILRLKNIDSLKVPISVYTGVYQIKKTDSMMVLSSPTTELELLNFDDAIRQQMDDAIRKQFNDAIRQQMDNFFKRVIK